MSQQLFNLQNLLPREAEKYQILYELSNFEKEEEEEEEEEEEKKNCLVTV